MGLRAGPENRSIGDPGEPCAPRTGPGPAPPGGATAARPAKQPSGQLSGEPRGLGGSGGPASTATGFTAELESGVETGLSQSRALGYRVRYWRGVPAWGDLGFWRVEGGAVGVAHGPGRLRPSAAVGFVHGSAHLPVALRGRAGGPFGWTGLRREEIFASRLLWSRVGLGWQLAGTLRLGVAAAVGWSDEESLRRASALGGAGVELAWKTPLGPCRMSWAVAERRNGAIFVQLGPEF